MKIYIVDLFEMDKPPSGYLELNPITHEKILQQLKDNFDHGIEFGFTNSQILVASIRPIEAKPEVITKKGGEDYFVIRGRYGYLANAQTFEINQLIMTSDIDDARILTLFEARFWCETTSLRNVKTEIIYSHTK